MTPSQFTALRVGITAFVITATLFLYFQGVFESLTIVGFGILVISYGAVAFLLYKFVASNPGKFE